MTETRQEKVQREVNQLSDVEVRTSLVSTRLELMRAEWVLRDISDDRTRLQEEMAKVTQIRKSRGQMLSDYRAVQVAVMNAMPKFSSDTVVEAFGALIAERDNLQTALAAAEGRAAIAEEKAEVWSGTTERWKARINAAEQQAATLREALRVYGRHLQCDADYLSVCGDSQRCTCGLDVAKALPPPPPRRTDPCPSCLGTGHSGNLHDETCPDCAGGGRADGG